MLCLKILVAAEAASCHSDFSAVKAIESQRERENNAPAEIDSLDKPLSGTSRAVRRMDFFPSPEKLGFDLWHRGSTYAGVGIKTGGVIVLSIAIPRYQENKSGSRNTASDDSSRAGRSSR